MLEVQTEADGERFAGAPKLCRRSSGWTSGPE